MCNILSHIGLPECPLELQQVVMKRRDHRDRIPLVLLGVWV